MAIRLTGQANLLTELSQGLNAFYSATAEMGVAQDVTAFTASDFGRTFPTNGTGSDHGWGSHQFVLGGAVQGGRLFGTLPDPRRQWAGRYWARPLDSDDFGG